MSTRALVAFVAIVAIVATVMVIAPPSQASAQFGPTCFGYDVTVNIALGQLPTDGDDVILGTTGNDAIAARAGDDLICGGGGNDSIWGQAGNDMIIGADGQDKLRGGDGDDHLYGINGDDDLNGGRDNDYVYGGNGVDSVRGGTGDDHVDGGDGDDTRVSGNGGSDAVFGGSGNDSLVSGGPRPDEVFGGPGDDLIRGLGGADRLFGDSGNDQIFGGNQPDLIDGGSGTDQCNGGQQDDRSMPSTCETRTVIESEVPRAVDYSSATQVTCPFEAPGNVICLKVTIPEDDTNPTNGRTVTIDVNIADNANLSGVGPIVLLDGGPGAAPGDDILFFAESDTDWITIAQRGTSGSAPQLNCIESDNLFGTLAGLDDEQAAELRQQADLQCNQRLRNSGVDFGAFNTEQNADDIDLVRQVLGVTEWNYYGASYATRLMSVIARDHPDGVRATVMDAMYPIESSETARTFYPQFLRLEESCQANPGCNANFGDLEGLLNEAFSELNANPITVVVTRDSGEQIDVVVTGQALVDYVFLLMYNTRDLPALPRLIHAAANGDVDEITRRAVPTRDPQLFDFSEGMFRSIECQDGRPDTELSAFFAFEFFAEVCEPWLDADDAWVSKTPSESPVPALILGGSFDPITPPWFGAQVADRMPNATFVEFSDQGHGASGQCFGNLFWNFMIQPTARLDTTCANVGGPAFELVAPPPGAARSADIRSARNVFGADLPELTPLIPSTPIEWPGQE